MNHPPRRHPKYHRHLSRLPPKLLSLREYALQGNLFYRFTPLAPTPCAPKGGGRPRDYPRYPILRARIQSLIRGLLVILDDLFEEGSCLSLIDDNTFAVDEIKEVPMLTAQGEQSIVNLQSGEQEDSNTKQLAAVIVDCIFRPHNADIHTVQEVGSGLIPMKNQDGNKHWYAILNHSSLVAMDNRLEMFMRVYDVLNDVVSKKSPEDFAVVLQEVEAPETWHEAISPEDIWWIYTMFGGSIYDCTNVNPVVTKGALLRFKRNSGVHGTTMCKRAISKTDIAKLHYVIAPVALHSMLKSMQSRGWLVCCLIHPCFPGTTRLMRAEIG